MIICQNCGTTNNEAVTNTCRTCGALLPVSSKSSRSKRIKAEKKKKEKQKPTEHPQIEPAELEEKGKEKLELHEIPTEDDFITEEAELQEIPQAKINEIESPTPTSKEKASETSKKEVLQEIPAQPYRSTIMDPRKSFQPPPYSTDTISNAFTELKSSVLDAQEKKQITPLAKSSTKSAGSNTATLKQKALEKDMTKVLSFLSKKISVKN